MEDQENDDFFAVLFEDVTLNTSLVTLGSLCWILNLVGSIGNWWYLRYATRRRNLVGRSVESLSKLTIQYLVLIQTVDILRYIYGPLWKPFCLVHLVLKNACNMCFALTVLKLSIAKHICSNWRDNFTDTQEEFFTIFTELWIHLVGNASQAIYVFMPGRQPVSYYVCAGTDTSFTKTKVNYAVLVADALSVMVFIGLTTKSIKLKLKLDRSLNDLSWKSALKNYRGDIFGYLFISYLAACYAFIATKLNSFQLNEVKKFPNHFYVHALFIIFPTLSTFLFTIFYFFQNRIIIKTLVEELQSFTEPYIQLLF